MNKKLSSSIVLSLALLIVFFHPGLTEATTDVTPPKLITLEFSREVVITGETVKVYITTENQINEVIEATLMLRSPSGLQSEYLWLNQKDSLGRLVGELQMPNDAELGLWEVGYISVEDNAYNYWKYFYQDGLAYEYDNFGNVHQLEVAPYTLEVTASNAENMDILTELEKIQSQPYVTIASIEDAFNLLVYYEELIYGLDKGENEVNLEIKLWECKTYLVNQLKMVIQVKTPEKISEQTLGFLVDYAIEEVKAKSVEESDLIVGFLKPILKGYASGHEVHKLINEKLN